MVSLLSKGVPNQPPAPCTQTTLRKSLQEEKKTLMAQAAVMVDAVFFLAKKM